MTWHNSVPLASIFEVASDSSTNHPLYSFYKLNRINTDLLIPEGVKSVNFEQLPKEYIDKIKGDRLSGKKYCLPQTLKSVSGYVDFGNYIYFPLYLNDGLEYIGPGVFKLSQRRISIPSSVKKISSFVDYYNGTIEFRDFKNSKIINDEEKFIEFIENFSTEVDTHKTDIHFPSKYNLKLQERYRKGGFSTSNHAALLDRQYNIYFYESQMTFEKICFTSEDLENPIVIPSSELTTTFKKEDSLFRPGGRFGGPNYNEIYLKIRNILLEKAGYDIAGSKETKLK